MISYFAFNLYCIRVIIRLRFHQIYKKHKLIYVNLLDLTQDKTQYTTSLNSRFYLQSVFHLDCKIDGIVEKHNFHDFY